MTAIWAIGMMSGTSLDGVDGAWLKTDGERVETFGPSGFRAYSPSERATLRAALDACKGRWSDGAPIGDPDREAWLGAARDIVAKVHLALCHELMASPPAPAIRPELIGFHGQTVWHDPDRGRTVQIGAPEALSTALGVDVAADFRSADMAAGGQGAPLAPFYHFALARWLGATAPIAFLNLGGVANATFVDPSGAGPEAPGALLAFDTGPANALLDDWMATRTGRAVDLDGATAAAGRVDAAALSQLLAHPYFSAAAPKSLDRNAFDGVASAISGLSTEDGAATLTAFTAASAALAERMAPRPPTRWLAVGGGRRNPTLMAMLAERLSAPIEPAEAAGIDGDMVEAQAFAHLAARSRRGLAISAPGSTGAPKPLPGGRLFRSSGRAPA